MTHPKLVFSAIKPETSAPWTSSGSSECRNLQWICFPRLTCYQHSVKTEVSIPRVDVPQDARLSCLVITGISERCDKSHGASIGFYEQVTHDVPRSMILSSLWAKAFWFCLSYSKLIPDRYRCFDSMISMEIGMFCAKTPQLTRSPPACRFPLLSLVRYRRTSLIS